MDNPTEPRLRELYAVCGEIEKGEVARYVAYEWKSPRGLILADEWIAAGATQGSYVWLLKRWRQENMEAFDRFQPQFARSDLDDYDLDSLIDVFSDAINFGERHPRYLDALALIAGYLDHPSPDIRWTAVFSLAKQSELPERYRDELRRKTEDTALSRYGYVSRVAKNFLSEDLEIDLRDAREP